MKSSWKILLCASIFSVFLIVIVKNNHGSWDVTTKHCPPENSTFVTVVPGGRLGNGIFEYLSAWALANLTDAIPLVPKEILKQISVAFGDIQILPLEAVASVCNIEYLEEVSYIKLNINH
jgi:hypothetical protein